MFPRAAELHAPSAQLRTGAASLPVAHGQVQAAGTCFPAGEKTSVAVKQSLASSQTARLGGGSLRVAFVLEVKRWGERHWRQRGGAELPLWPGKLEEDVSARLVPLL